MLDQSRFTFFFFLHQKFVIAQNEHLVKVYKKGRISHFTTKRLSFCPASYRTMMRMRNSDTPVRQDLMRHPEHAAMPPASCIQADSYASST